MNIIYSSDTNKASKEDVEIISQMAENYFKMREDPTQIKAAKETKEWIYTKFPESLNIIKNKDRIIGFTWVLPCSKELMNQFLEKKLNEFELFERIKQRTRKEKIESIYLCSSIIEKDFQNRGLATKGFVKSIKLITKNKHSNITLFYWPFSKEGKALAEKVAKLTNFELEIRNKEDERTY